MVTFTEKNNSEEQKNMSSKRKVYTEKDFKNPTEAMKKDFWWKHDLVEWQVANGQSVTLSSEDEITEYMNSL